MGEDKARELRKIKSEKMKNRIVKKETRDKLSKLHKGKKLSEEHKRSLSKNHRGYQSKNTKIKISENSKINPNYGMRRKHHSNEVKEKLRISSFNYIRKRCNFLFPNIGHNEKEILDKLEIEFGYRILRQYEVDGYFIDGYILELNLAIEVDEHPKNKEKDIQRQKFIENKLNCKFIRINDFD